MIRAVYVGGRHLGISHIKLIGAQIIQCCRIGRSLQESSKTLDPPNVGFLSLVAHPEEAHIADHPLT
jgi:hypothetical protein